jgi:small subunit ribosomal protein S2
MTTAVVRLLEVVDVEQEQRQATAITVRPRSLCAEASVEGGMVEDAGQRVTPGLLGQLPCYTRDVSSNGGVEGGASTLLAAAVEEAAEGKELGDDLVGSNSQSLTFAGVPRERLRRLVGRRRHDMRDFPSRRTDSRGHTSTLERASASEPGAPLAREASERRETVQDVRRAPASAASCRQRRQPPAKPGFAWCEPRRPGLLARLEWPANYPKPGGLTRVAVPGSTRFHSPPPAGSTNQPRRISLPVVSMRELLEAGVHFGHQTRRWNPKMRRYIFTERGGIYIIDLQKTLALLEQAHAFARNVAERGGTVMFVGTKKQCQDAVAEEATRVGMPYVNHRWLGGLLTNWRTISERIERLHELRRLRNEGQLELLPAKERMAMKSELEKLETNLGGVLDMKGVPDAVFVIDLKKEQLAIKEARRLGLPVIALVDTNCDPDDADYVVPGNDDAIRSCSLVIRAIADGIAAGQTRVTAEEIVPPPAASEEPQPAEAAEPAEAEERAEEIAPEEVRAE